jgi:CheY-like chemotaxis protein
VQRAEETPPQPIDDREHLSPQEPVLLIVEDDPHYSRIIIGLAHDEGLKVLIAARGAEALALAREFRPLAISLDVFLPDMMGWAVLSQLKQDPQTRHIPVQIITLDDDRQHGLAGGAFSFVNKPTTMDKLKQSISRLTKYARTSKKRLLVVEDSPSELIGITELLRHDDIDLVIAETGRDALAMLRDQPSDCIVLDHRLPDMSGFELLEQMVGTMR